MGNHTVTLSFYLKHLCYNPRIWPFWLFLLCIYSCLACLDGYRVSFFILPHSLLILPFEVKNEAAHFLFLNVKVEKQNTSMHLPSTVWMFSLLNVFINGLHKYQSGILPGWLDWLWSDGKDYLTMNIFLQRCFSAIL